MDTYTLILVPLAVAIVPAFISYLVSSRQATHALKLAKDQQAAALQQLKEQQENEMKILREQQKSEMEKIKYQSEHEIEKMKIEMDKQAELHERNTQTDITKDFFAQMMGGGEDSLGNLLDGMEKIESLQKKMNTGTFKNNNHPASNKRR